LSLARRALKEKFPTPTVPLTPVLPNHQVFLLDPVYIKFTLEQATKAQRGRRGIALFFL
jgi:hypothetical protein